MDAGIAMPARLLCHDPCWQEIGYAAPHLEFRVRSDALSRCRFRTKQPHLQLDAYLGKYRYKVLGREFRTAISDSERDSSMPKHLLVLLCSLIFSASAAYGGVIYENDTLHVYVDGNATCYGYQYPQDIANLGLIASQASPTTFVFASASQAYTGFSVSLNVYSDPAYTNQLTSIYVTGFGAYNGSETNFSTYYSEVLPSGYWQIVASSACSPTAAGGGFTGLTISQDGYGSTTTLTPSSSSVALNDPVTLAATVTAPASGNTPTGSISFSDQYGLIATVPLSNNGTASYTTSSLYVGSHLITASYSGDATLAGSASTAITETIQINGALIYQKPCAPCLCRRE